MLVKGMLVYSSGVAEGQPFIHYGAVCIKDGDDGQKERAQYGLYRVGKPMDYELIADIVR